MKKIFLLLALLSATGVQAQFIVSKFRVSFSDKTNSPYSINRPEEFLSARAIERRQKQNIMVTENDLPVNSWFIDSIRNTGALILNPSKWFNCVTISTTDPMVIAHIRSLPFVSDVDSIAETSTKKGVRLKKRTDSMDGSKSLNSEASAFDFKTLMYNEASIIHNCSDHYGRGYSQISQIATDKLHRMGYCGDGMVIAVLDAGFFSVNNISLFDSLWSGNRILGSKDFVEPGGDVFIRSTHGMMVLSTMGGNIPGQLIGTAPHASYWLLRSEDSDSEYPIEEDNWVSAAEFADSVGADVINSSLGYTDFYNPDWSHSYQQMDGKTTRVSLGASMAASKGILVVNSAGNSGNEAWHYIGAPADADHIITVGAVNDQGNIASFSSRGPTSDGRIKPTVSAMGEGTYVSSSAGTPMPSNGTSFSSPVIAGSVACLWQANPGKTNNEIIAALIASADRYMKPDSIYGYGIPNFAAAHMILSGISIENFDAGNKMNISPNPFNDQINILFYSSDTASIQVQIFDLQGKITMEKTNIKRSPGCNYISINGLEELSQGVYVLKVISGTKMFTEKIVKK